VVELASQESNHFINGLKFEIFKVFEKELEKIIFVQKGVINASS